MSLSTNETISNDSNIKQNKNSISKLRSSLYSVLVVRAKWSWETESKILKLNPFDSVIDGMSAVGFSSSSVFDLAGNSTALSIENYVSKKSVINTMPSTQNIKYYYVQEPTKPIDPIDETKIFYICNGKILIEDVSFDFQGVKNGMTIIVYSKIIKKNKNEKKLRFLQSIRNSQISSSNLNNIEPYCQNKSNFKLNIDQRFNQNQQLHVQLIRKAANEANLIDQSRRSEISRLNDMAFNAWETMPEYPTLLKEMLKNEEEENKKVSTTTAQKRHQISYSGYDFRCGLNNDNFNKSTVLKPSSQINDQPLPNPFIRKNSLSGSTHIKSIEGDIPNVSHTERKTHLSKTYKKQNKSE